MRHDLIPLSMTALLFGLVIVTCRPASAFDDTPSAQDFEAAVTILTELAPNVPEWVWPRLDCISVAELGRGGFIVGGTHGRGYLTCREDQSGDWSAPTVLEMGGGSAGFQIGGQRVQMVMLFVGVSDLEDTTEVTPVLQMKASAAAGESGIGISGGVNPAVESEVITVSHGEGLYAGATFEGLVVGPDHDANQALYGRAVTAQELLVDRTVAVPDIAAGLIEAVTKEASRARGESTQYAPPSVRPGEDGWSLYDVAPTWNADTVAGLRPGNTTAEAAVVHYLASRVRGDKAFEDVLPLGITGDERMQRKLAEHQEWTFHAFRLVGRKEAPSGEQWIKVWMQISSENDEDSGEDEFTVLCSRDACIVTSVPN
jgi:SH3 domain-containing YSC84-like protein 1